MIFYFHALLSGKEPIIKWRKGDTEINGSNERFQINQDTEACIYSLVIVNAQVDDAGKYFVSASNAGGVAKASVKITVEEEESGEESSEESSSEEESSEASSSEASEEEETPKEPPQTMPTISAIGEDINVVVGSIVKIACKVAGK